MLAAELFSLRAGLLLHGLGAGAARARLYVTALAAQGVPSRTCDVTEATLARLKAAHDALTAAG